MATSSFLRTTLIESTEQAKAFCDALEKSEKTHNTAAKPVCYLSRDIADDEVVEFLLPTKTKRKSRSKYQKGDKITSLDELAKCDFIYFEHKVYHRGWWQSWQFHWILMWVGQGRIYRAEKVEVS